MSPLTAQDVLSDVEFEIAQSAVSRDDLGQGIQAVRQFQAKTRAEIFDSRTGALDQRQIISRQFQILEMQTTLLQETAAAIRTLQLDLRRVGQALAQRASNLALRTAAGVTPESAGNDQILPPADWALDEVGSLEFAPEKVDQIEQAMQRETLNVKVDARPVKVPLIGRVLQRLRTAVHSLAWFYAYQLGQRQTSVNQLYGEQLLHLMRLANAQQQQLAQLNAYLAQLQTRRAVRDETDADA
jgi:hypothetical protein